MKRTLIGMMAVGAMLSYTLTAQAAPQLLRGAQATPVSDLAPGQAPNAGSIDDDCTSGGFNLGMLTGFQQIPANTADLVHDFGCDPVCGAPCAAGGTCAYYGAAGQDGIATFTVPNSGLWQFSTCGTAGSHDTSLAIREGGVCPGDFCVGQDDDSCAGCAPPYKARLSANLTAGTTYYLIVDAFSGGGLSDLVVTGPCAGPADCQDGLFCNGAEVCTAGRCAAGAPACSGNTPICDEAMDTCVSCASNPAICTDDGLFCNGPGVCLPSGACGQGGNPCSAIQTCDEVANVCNNLDPCLTFRNSDFILPGNFFPQCTNANCNTEPTGDYSYGDDIELAKHSSRLVTSYGFYTQGRDTVSLGATCNNNGAGHINPAPLGAPYIVNAALFTVAPGTCFPDALIPGSECTVGTGVISAGGTPADVVVCNLATPVQVPDGNDNQLCFGECSDDLSPCTADANCNIGATCTGTNLGDPCLTDVDCGGAPSVCLDTNTSECGVDFYMVMNSNVDSVGVAIGCTTLIGGPGVADELATDAMVFATCTGVADPIPGQWNGWRFALAGPGGASIACPVNRGNWRGQFVCTEPTGACCNPTEGTCSVETLEACDLAGGTFLGEIAVDGSGGCDDGVDTDGDGSRDECDLCDDDADKTAPGQCGCGVADTDTDADGTADCNDGCPQDPGKTDPGICGCGNADTDSDLDGTADCQDQCPNDPNKVTPGVCGCGVPETGDTDGDGVSDCVDQCPGVDDAVFFPGCQGAIPTVSEWGMVVLALLLLAGAKVYFGRRTVQA